MSEGVGGWVGGAGGRGGARCGGGGGGGGGWGNTQNTITRNKNLCLVVLNLCTFAGIFVFLASYLIGPITYDNI